jgi:hypothetical protein
MGTFCTTTAIDTLMPGITFDSNTTAFVSQVIDWSESEIKSCLGRRYDFSGSPFNTSTSIPPVIRTLCEKLTIGHTHEVMSRGGKESITRGQNMVKQAREQIKMIAERKCNVLDTSGADVLDLDGTNRVLGSHEDYHTTFDEDSPLNWKVDCDKLDDIESDRL